jgi:hypothetical protein
MDEKNLNEIDEIKNSLAIECDNASTCNIIVLAISKNGYDKNTRIPLNHGVPIGGASIDNVSQTFMVPCKSWKALGKFPLYTIRSGTWRQVVPLPDSVIVKKLSSNAISVFEDFRANYSNCNFVFLQLIGLE